jgi:hypothetical protein
VIYDLTKLQDDIRQGDIFIGLPRIDISLERILLIGEDSDEETSWRELLSRQNQPVTLAVAARPVTAIVITQDCDTLRASQITLCEIRPLDEVVKDLGSTTAKFVKNVPRQSRQNLKWFYLPPDLAARIPERMAVDFQVTLSVARADLETLRPLRYARLNDEADEHFRERLSEFFRRYPVDEWYPFSKAEFEEYRIGHPEAQPRLWQR